MAASKSKPRGGCSSLIIGILFLIFAGAFGADMGYIYLLDECAGEITLECVEAIGDKVQEEESPTFTATGTKSGTFAGEERNVTVSLTVPKDGGAFTGSFTGSCDGTIQGTYSKGTGTLSGTGGGSCAFVFPASGTIAGPVNTLSKTIPLSIAGSAGGFSGETSMVLGW